MIRKVDVLLFHSSSSLDPPTTVESVPMLGIFSQRRKERNLINSPSAIGPVKTFYDVGMYVREKELEEKNKKKRTYSNVDDEFDFFCHPQLDYRLWNTLMSTNIMWGEWGEVSMD